MLKKNNLQSPKLNLDEFKSSYNIKNLDHKLAILPKTSETVEPFIFKKKKSPIKNISYIQNDSGKMRHFTPAAQEWYNSVYSYNKNYVKLLPSADKTVTKLLKSYFNFFVNNQILKTKRIANRYRKLSANKVFVGKGELKHVNDKVIITSYIYNAERLYLKSLVRKEAKSLFYPNKELKKEVNINKNRQNIITYNRPFTIYEYLNLHNKPSLPNHSLLQKKVCFKLFWKWYIKLIGLASHKKLKNQEKEDKELEKKFEMKYGGKEEGKIFLNLIKLKMISLNSISDDNAIKTLLNSIDKDTITAIDNLNYNELKFKDKIEIIFLRDFFNIKDDTTYKNFIDPLLELAEKNNPRALLLHQQELLKFKQQVLKIRKVFNDFDLYMNMAKNNYLKNFYRFVYLLMINTVKFKTPFASKLYSY